METIYSKKYWEGTLYNFNYQRQLKKMTDDQLNDEYEYLITKGLPLDFFMEEMENR